MDHSKGRDFDLVLPDGATVYSEDSQMVLGAEQAKESGFAASSEVA